MYINYPSQIYGKRILDELVFEFIGENTISRVVFAPDTVNALRLSLCLYILCWTAPVTVLNSQLEGNVTANTSHKIQLYVFVVMIVLLKKNRFKTILNFALPK